MNRRDFLKLSSTASAFTFASVGPLGNLAGLPIETVAFGRIYRAKDGKVHTSKDGGKSWQLHTRLPKGFSILDLFLAADKRLYVHVGYKRVNFHLVLTKDRKYWSAQKFNTTPKPRS